MGDDRLFPASPKVWAVVVPGGGGQGFLHEGYGPGSRGTLRRSWQVLTRCRRARPPLAIGGVAFLLAAWMGAPLWAGVVTSLVVALLGGMIPARWGGDPESDLGVELLEIISPRAAMRRTRRLTVRMLRSSSLPLYGLPGSWPGRRYLGGYDVSGRRLRTLELVHEQSPGVGRLRVEISDDPRRRGPRFLRLLAERLRIEAGVPPGNLPPDRVDAWTRSLIQEIAARGAPQWRSIRISVEDRPVGFAYLSEGGLWIAHGELDGCTLTLHATDPFEPEAVRLVRVRDPQVYMEERDDPG